MKKKKILFFLWSFSLGGGAEKILSTIVNNLDKDKYDIDILELEHFDKGTESVCKNVKILKSWMNYKQNRITRMILWRIRKYFPNIVRKILIKEDYDIEVSFTITNPPFPFSKNKNVKKIAWIHGSIEEFLKDDTKKNTHKIYLKDVDKIISVSEKTKNSIICVYKEYKQKVLTIYNGYDFDKIIKKSNEKLDIEIKKNSICIVGRIEDQKGSLEVYETIKKIVKESKKDYNFYFLGSGELEDTLKNKTKIDNLNKNVHFLGYQKNPYKYIKHMSLMFSMSKQEGFSGAIVEAMALKVPFVSTDVGGIKELSLDGKFGKVVYSTDDAKEKIINFVEKKYSFDTEEMKNYITKFTIDKQIKNIEKLF